VTRRSARKGPQAYMVSRSFLVVTTMIVCVLLAGALGLVAFEHARNVEGDSLFLEVAAGLLVVVLLILGTIPLRLRFPNRRLERELTSLQNGTLPAGKALSALSERRFMSTFGSFAAATSSSRER
jgi:hypothetical protein